MIIYKIKKSFQWANNETYILSTVYNDFYMYLFVTKRELTPLENFTK